MSDINKLTPGKKLSAADKLTVAISDSTGHQGRVVNRTMTWPKFCEKLGFTQRDTLTTKEFKRLSEVEQHKRKNRGYFVGGPFEKGVRKIEHLQSRTMLTLDADKCSVPMLAELFKPLDGWLSDYEYFVYTTRSHTPENPRVRIVIPLAAPIVKDHDKFRALTRIVSHHIDPEMETVDPVSFRPAQIMYFPSTNREAEFRSYRHEGRLLDADEILTAFGKWNNIDLLPRSPREKNVRRIGTKVQDPRTKRGPVGAFCRVYPTIHDVIEKYLSDIYVPGETNADGTERYTYTKGTSTNGLVLYDDGTQAYSNHGSDPAADRLSNGYDLARIHLYGHLDKPEDIEAAEDDPKSLPSYKAFNTFLQDDEEVSAELMRGQLDLEAMADDAEFELDEDDVAEVTSDDIQTVTTPPSKKVDKPGEPEAEPDKAKDWTDDLDRNEKGSIKSTLHNVILILLNDKRFKGALAYNEFINEPVILRRIRSKQYGHDTGTIKNKSNGDMVTGSVLANIRAILEAPRGEHKSGWGLRVSDRDLEAAVERAAQEHTFHPVRLYIKSCKWDGVPRLRTMLHVYWHAANNAYHGEVGFLWMVGTVTRIFEPGHKFDFVPIFEGLTGIQKSRAPEKLIGRKEWIAEFTAKATDPTAKVIENLLGKVFVELPELITFMRADNEHTKALFSARADRARLAWARGPKDYYRQCTFYGTTNDAEYFRDQTGNRRYWPVKLPDEPIDVEALERDRDMIWAEAYQWYLWYRRNHNPLDDLPLYIRDPDIKAFAEGQQAARMIETDYGMLKGRIVEWLNTPVPANQAEPGWEDDGSELEPDTQKSIPAELRKYVCVADVVRHCLNEPLKLGDGRANSARSATIGRILTSVKGWTKLNTHHCGRLGTQKVWKRRNTR